MFASCMNAGESSTMKWVLFGLFGVSCRFISRTMRRASVSISPSCNAAIWALKSPGGSCSLLRCSSRKSHLRASGSLGMLECGFCGGTLTRRSWHSGSQYNKVIWQCVTATKKGKKFCPDSKGIAEETIEQAFIESYRLLCQNNKDVLDEFIARTEETLSDSNASKQLAKVEKDIAALDAKRAKLVDMRLEEIIDKETYEQKYFDLSSQIEQLQKQRESLQESAETESTMKKRIAEFRRTLEENEVLDTFDRYVFESIVEKVIVGGYDEDGNKDPAMLTFIYKTGFKNSLDGTNFKPPRKNSKAAKQNAGLCSHTTDEAKSMCSYHSDDTCGVRTSNDP